MLRFRTLGRFELVDGDPPASHAVAAQPKRLALLAYLALARPNGPQRRDTLLALFWPELNDEEARRALRQALHALRQLLGATTLVSLDHDRIGLADGALWCDAVELERLLADGHQADALALYEGDFFAGIFIADTSPELEQWTSLTRDRLRQAAMKGAMALAVVARDAQAHSVTIDWARKVCALAPEDEAAARFLMTSMALTGDRTGALRVYEALRARLASELDIEPDTETHGLADSLRDGPFTPTPMVVSTPVPKRIAIPVADDVPAAAADPVAGPVSGQPPSRRRLILVAIAALGVIAVATVAWAGLRPTMGLGLSQSILVADFRNHTRDSLLAQAVTEAISIDLAQSQHARVLTRAQVQTVMLRMEMPNGVPLTDAVVREVAEREGVTAYLTGEIASLGPGYTVSVELVSVKTGEVLSAFRESAADSTRLLAAVDQLSSRLRRRVGDSFWAVMQSPPLERVTTSSLAALRRYSEAIRIGDQGGDDRRAIGVLREAVALDTTFAMAWRKLGTYLREFNELSGARDALSRAFRYRDRLPDRERYLTMASFYAGTDRADSAIAAYRALVAEYPGDTRALNNLGYVYEQLKRFGEADPFFHRALESDSSFSLIYNHLAENQFNEGKFTDVEHTLAARQRRFPPQQDAEILALSVLVARGQLDSAQARAERLFGTAGDDVERRTQPLLVLSDLALQRGRLADAERYMQMRMDIEARDGGPVGYLDGAISLAFIQIVYRHDSARGVRMIDSALTRYPLDSIAPLDRGYPFLAYVFALAGQPARSRAFLVDLVALDSAPATRGSRGIGSEGGYLRSRGTAEMAEGRYRKAQITLHRAADIYFCPTCALPDLARSYELTGARDSAVAVYVRYLNTPWSQWFATDGQFRGLVLQRLAQLYDVKADTLRAVAAYEALAILWSGADTELQPQVALARQRVAALRKRQGAAVTRQ